MNPKHYSGKPCIFGHGTLRYGSNKQCVKCKQLKCAADYASRPEVFAARSKAWATAHGEKYLGSRPAYRKSRREQIRANRKSWVAKNRALLAACEQKRRARKSAAGGAGVTPDQWQDVLDSSGGLCAYCNERHALAMDHIDPLALGGAHDPENIVAACKVCNSSKGDVPLLIWLARRARRRNPVLVAA